MRLTGLYTPSMNKYINNMCYLIVIRLDFKGKLQDEQVDIIHLFRSVFIVYWH